MSDIGFEQILAQHNAAYKEAKEFSDWMPPDGDYVILIKACERGSKQRDDGALLWWKHTAEVVAGDNWENIQGKEFTSLFCSSNNYGIAKSQAKVLAGTTPDGTADLDRVLMGAEGALVKVNISTKAGKKGEFTNCYYREVVDQQSVEAPLPGAPEETT